MNEDTLIGPQFQAQDIEQNLYALWEKKGYFAPKHSDAPKYCIVMPPPNVTGVLHMGHAIVNTLQDVLIRWKRMRGFDVLWVPGVDHAGIATQTVVERKLMQTMNKRRVDFERQEFLDHVWRWKEENEHIIVNQLKRLGSSCDWSSLRFTMDEVCSKSVKHIFKKMYEDGLIYRGDYLVNWDPVTQTALADDEVEYEDHEGFIWTLKYPLADNKNEFILIATTRPETMLGDTALAVNPKDPRYAHLVGKKVQLPLTNRQIPIITDDHVDKEFGTGVVKVTPAHDPNDYEIGLRHNLPRINIMTPNGCINENGGKYQGLSMSAAREQIIKDLSALGLVEQIRPHHNRIGVSYRSKAIIEPYMSKQWFVRMNKNDEIGKKKLKQALTDQQVRFTPKNWENTYFHWIDNLRDWCISRQLWWGHQIPVWYNIHDPSKMICEIETPKVVLDNPQDWVQDPDVLDTWFSSALWPFSVLHYPEFKDELAAFYPNAVLVTGHDILFFWVARMMFMGNYALKKWPFENVFLHGLIYGKSYWRKNPNGGIQYVSDEERKQFDLGAKIPKDVLFKWEKMSKSKGNVINPIELINEYGADAIRLGLCASAPQSRQIDLDRRKFNEFRNFTNKIWNGARFCFMNIDPKIIADITHIDSNLFNLEDEWILNQLYETILQTNMHLDQFNFDAAAIKVYEFFWNDFCSQYVEIIKPVLFKKGTAVNIHKQKMLFFLLDHFLRLMHVFAPFITEELYQKLKSVFPTALKTESLMLCQYPTIENFLFKNLLEKLEKGKTQFQIVEKIITHIRMIRSTQKIPPHQKTSILITSDNQKIDSFEHIILALIPVDKLYTTKDKNGAALGISSYVEGLEVQIEMPQELKQAMAIALEKRKIKLEENIEKLKNQLANSAFCEKAPAAVIEKMKGQLAMDIKEVQEMSSIK